MPHQQDLFPPEVSDPAVERPQPGAKHANPPAPIWLQRTSIAILVVFCSYVGLLLLFLPWTQYWRENQYLLRMPFLGTIMNSGITRGIASGLGLLDLWIGISEVIQYREYRS